MATKCRSVCLHLGLHKEFSHAQTYLQNSVLKLFAKPQSYSCSPDDVMSSGSWFTPPSILWLQAAKEVCCWPACSTSLKNWLERASKQWWNSRSILIWARCVYVSSFLKTVWEDPRTVTLAPDICHWRPKLVLQCLPQLLNTVVLWTSHCLQCLDPGLCSTTLEPQSISINPLSNHLNRGFSISLHCMARSFSPSSSCIDFPGNKV